MSVNTLEQNPRPAAVATMLHGPACPCGGCQSLFTGGISTLAGGTSLTAGDSIAASASREQDRTEQQILGLTIAGGLVAGAAVLGDSARRWWKSNKAAAPTKGLCAHKHPKTIQAGCTQHCGHH